MRLKADLTLLLVAILWGSAFSAQRVAGELGSVYWFNAIRFWLAALILLPFVFRNRIPREQWPWMVAAGTVLFLGSAFQQAGLVTTTAGNGGFITSLYVVLVPIVMFIGWREKPHWLAILAVFLAAAGAFLLSTAGRFQPKPGDLLELAGALFWAFHVVLVGRFTRKFDAISFSVGQLVFGGLLNLTSAVIFEGPMPALQGSLLGAIVYTAVVSIGVAYTLQIWGQKHTPPTDAAILLSLESVFAVVGGWLVLNERLLPIQIIGCVIILAAVILSQAKGWGKIEMEAP